MSNPQVSAIVVNRDGGEALFACLASLSGQQGVRLEIVVVDNGSRPDEVERVRSEHPGVRLVAFPRNLGFAAAANEGAARAAAELLLFVNNDATLAPDYADLLRRRLGEDASLACAQGLVLRASDGRIDSAGLRWNARGEALPWLAGEARGAAPPAPTPVPGVNAAAALYRRKALDEVSPDGKVFDPRFFAYYEDVDLAARLARAGWRALLEPSALALHAVSMTGGRMPRRRALWIARNRWRTLLANFDPAFLRRRFLDLVRADLAHARSSRAFGAVILAGVASFWLAALLSRGGGAGRLSAFPLDPVAPR